MAAPPRCSVIIPTYNREALLRRTLDSLAGQDLPADSFEVLVADDGSSDATADLVAHYGGRLDVRYFFQPDEGFRAAAARNLGIAHARGELCVLLDSGLLAHSHCLSAHIDLHAATADPVAGIGYVYCFDKGDDDAAQMIHALDFSRVDATIDRLRSESRWLDLRETFYAKHPDPDLSRLPAPWLVYWSCNVSAPTALLREVGGFDERFRTWGGEDVELGIRLQRAGARFALDRRAAAIHYPHPKDHAANRRVAAANYRYIADKHPSPITKMLTADPAPHFFDINEIVLRNGLGA